MMDIKTALVRGQGDDIASGKWAFCSSEVVVNILLELSNSPCSDVYRGGKIPQCRGKEAVND